jgi:hypothetical protein
MNAGPPPLFVVNGFDMTELGVVAIDGGIDSPLEFV